MPQQWTMFFAAVVLAASLACGEVLDVEDAPDSSNGTEDIGVNVQSANSDFELTLELAEQGDARAQFEVGRAYHLGLGVPQDLTEAVRWARLAAAQGLAEAEYYVGYAYDNGDGVPQNFIEAVRLYRLAADQGLAEAQFNLGTMYANGDGVPQDDVQAYMWFKLAAARLTETGREMAVDARDEVADVMTADQLTEAQRLAREWDEAHPRE